MKPGKGFDQIIRPADCGTFLLFRNGRALPVPERKRLLIVLLNKV